MSIELPSAWSGSKRIGWAEVETWIVEIESDFVAEAVAESRGSGTAVNVAAAPAAPRNFRRDILKSFMGTGKYKRKATGSRLRFHSMKVLVALDRQSRHDRFDRVFSTATVMHSCVRMTSRVTSRRKIA
jgi:hypothetical protein